MMIDGSQIDHGIASHARWKYRLFDAVKTGESEWTVEQIRSHTNCEFGRWLATLSPDERQSEQCRAVVKMHQEFHIAASGVLDLALRGQTEAAQAAIALNSPFSLLSANLTAAMTAWKASLDKS
jgi:hypothetical protein